MLERLTTATREVATRVGRATVEKVDLSKRAAKEATDLLLLFLEWIFAAWYRAAIFLLLEVFIHARLAGDIWDARLEILDLVERVVDLLPFL